MSESHNSKSGIHRRDLIKGAAAVSLGLASGSFGIPKAFGQGQVGSNLIQLENAKPGTRDWMLTRALVDDEMKALSAEYAPVASELRRRTVELVRRTAIRAEFEGKKPSVKGILVGGGRGLAVVDGKPLRPGDSISEFLLLEVASDRVKFEYKGEAIPVYLTGGRDNN